MDVLGECASDLYRRRRDEVAAQASGAGRAPANIEYTTAEHATWSAVLDALIPRWRATGARSMCAGVDALSLPRHRVPQLSEVTAALAPLTGFRFEAVSGLVDKVTFFGALADRRFLSTQYVRWGASPLYTPEPDVIHEVVGHAHVLTDPRLANLHVLAGQALTRLEASLSQQFVADVFWFSGEFGVVTEGGRWRAYGAGLLSSVGELDWFADHARVRALDIAAMGTLPYDITQYQPVLFGARSLDEVLDVVGGFFAGCTDDSITALVSASGGRHWKEAS